MKATRDKSYYVSLPLSHYENICQKVRNLLSMVYIRVGIEADTEISISDDDGTVIGDVAMIPNPDESKWNKDKIKSSDLPTYIHKIAEGVDYQ